MNLKLISIFKIREAFIKKKKMTFVILGGGVKNIKNVSYSESFETNLFWVGTPILAGILRIFKIFTSVYIFFQKWRKYGPILEKKNKN